MDYYVYSDHGEILRTGSCAPEAVQVQGANPGEHVAIGRADPKTHHVVSGQLVEMSPERRAARNSQPDYKSRWDHQNGTWADLRTPEEQRLYYREQRARAYPPIGDQLDALWKSFRHMAEGGTDIGSDAEAMKQAVADVKARFPKP